MFVGWLVSFLSKICRLDKKQSVDNTFLYYSKIRQYVIIHETPSKIKLCLVCNLYRTYIQISAILFTLLKKKFFLIVVKYTWASQAVLVVRNPPDNAGDTEDVGLIPGSGRSLGVGMAPNSSILTW